ncbi:TrbC/VirB2 family protein [Myxococcus xanthus]|uniref:TrbC/VirB2 family protein n=1 Tax=Myxococcus xanthus TaxID=34 RepID=UPI001916DFB2|nr:TrbC/VirB2 family protein [Myxococcus xanthus]QQR46543.1 TrbC/VirB2 family protein [Myxococcus xanthus]
MKHRKTLILSAALGVLIAAPVALAQSTGAAAGGILDTIIASVFTPSGIATVLGAVGTGVALFAGGSWLSERRKRRIALAAFHAFNIVEDIAAENPEDNGWDKAARGLQVADEWFRANGWRPLKPHEQAVVKLSFSAIHGEQKAAQKASQSTDAAALAAAHAVTSAGLEKALPVPSTPHG